MDQMALDGPVSHRGFPNLCYLWLRSCTRAIRRRRPSLALRSCDLELGSDGVCHVAAQQAGVGERALLLLEGAVGPAPENQIDTDSKKIILQTRLLSTCVQIFKTLRYPFP